MMLLTEKKGRTVVDVPELEHLLREVFDDWGITDDDERYFLCEDIAKYVMRWAEQCC